MVVYLENLLTNMAVQEFWKSVHICQSYDKKKSSVLFFETVYIIQVVSVTFEVLSLEASYECSYDSVSLYDGSITNSSSLGTFCTSVLSTITSSSSSIFVVFRTDHTANVGRFALSWTLNSPGDERLSIDSLMQINTVC